MLQRKLAMTDGQETGQAGFRGQQVVIAFVAAAIVHVETHGQQLPLRVEEETKIHRGKLPAESGKQGDLLQFAAGCQGGSAGRLPYASKQRRESVRRVLFDAAIFLGHCRLPGMALGDLFRGLKHLAQLQPASSRADQA